MANVSEELARLAALRDQGVLTDEEFQAQKRQVLAGGSATTPAPELLVPARRGRLGKGCVIAVAVLGVLFIIGLALAPSTPPSAVGGADTVTATPAPEPAIEVTSVELARAYEANEAAAQQKYGGKALKVSGTVEGVTLDFADDPVVQLQGVNPFLNVQANLGGGSKAKASQLQKGQEITLICSDVSEAVSMPLLKECEIK
jgi:hypothetical protein